MARVSNLFGTLVAPLPLAVLAALLGGALWWVGLSRLGADPCIDPPQGQAQGPSRAP